MNAKILVAGAAGALALAGVAIAQSVPSGAGSPDSMGGQATQSGTLRSGPEGSADRSGSAGSSSMSGQSGSSMSDQSGSSSMSSDGQSTGYNAGGAAYGSAQGADRSGADTAEAAMAGERG